MAITKETIQSDVKEVAVEEYKTTLGTDEVIIGSEKVTFAEILPDQTVKEYVEPTVCFTRWNKEESLTLSYPDTLFSDKTLVDGVLKMSAGAEEFYFNQHDEDTLKFGLILNEIPSKDKIVTIDGKEYYQWQFKLVGWENFEFLYQVPWIDYKIIDFLGEKYIENKDGCRRKPDVNGSYAVYHLNKRNHEEGKINYGSGKVGMFLCPKFIDANGDIKWSILNITEGVYTVSVEADWLVNAAYPVKANDTFGNTGVGANYFGTPPTGDVIILGGPFTLAQNASVSKITYYGMSYQSKCNVYSNSGSDPATAQGSTAENAMQYGGYAWYDHTYSSALSLNSGTYWFAMWGGPNSGYEYYPWYDDATGEGASDAGNTYSTWPSTWDTAGDTKPLNRRISIYATYTAGGGGFTSGGSLKNVFIEW